MVKRSRIARILHKHDAKTKVVSSDEAMQEIRNGYKVFIAGNCGVPHELHRALVRRAPEVHDVQVFHCVFIADGIHVAPELNGHLRLITAFVSPCVRDAVNEGRAGFIPIHLSQIPYLWDQRYKIDVSLLHVSPPDEHGWCSVGVEAGLDITAARKSRIVIAQVNKNMPRVLGNSFVHVKDIDYIVECHEPLSILPNREPDDVTKSIGYYASGLIEDGATLQTGIGEIPNAVLSNLYGHRDLGVHTELFSDGVIPLVRNGIINNRKKTFHPDKIIAGFVLGNSPELYKFIHNNPRVELHPIEYVNNPSNIAKNHKMTVIVSALEVDLIGQVVAGSIGRKIFSGVGGQVDFIIGASRCFVEGRGGRPIIALPSTYEKTVDGEKKMFSRIVATLKEGAAVTTTCDTVHFVVTEFGVADLWGRPICERSRELIKIAHPMFREELEREAKRLRRIYF